MRPAFYDSPEYRRKQALITARKHREGVFKSSLRKEVRICKRPRCGQEFIVIPSDPKLYCSNSCAAKINNVGRIKSLETRQKLKESMQRLGITPHNKGKILVPRIEITCGNPACRKIFLTEQWKQKRGRRYCSTSCAMKINGSLPTSPKASKGKSGIRPDISDSVNFYSRWEANFARICNHLGLRWVHTPKSFDIGGQKYTPDFYLPDREVYVEIKNFWNDYSRTRDEKFRSAYPQVPLLVIVKDKYYNLESLYSKSIPDWEFKNSPAPK